jgi:serine protease Do
MSTNSPSGIPVGKNAMRVVVLLLCLLSCPVIAGADDKPLWTELPAAKKETGSSGRVPRNTFARLAERLSGAIVHVEVTRRSRSTGRQWPTFDWWHRQQSRDKETTGIGTGFIINPDGYVLTNNHVVENSRSLRVRTVNDEEFDARLVGADPLTDLALLRIEGEGPFTAAPLGNSDDLRIGEWVIAIGSPFGLDHTVTAGIISATGRKEVIPGKGLLYANFIQTDASINPGNSGGPLINMHGEVIGINTAIVVTGQGIGFAIPVNMSKRLLPQLAQGRVKRAYLGVFVQDVTRKIADSFALKEPHGALVDEVIPGSPAEVAGLQAGDVIIQVGDQPVTDRADLSWLAATSKVGEALVVQVIRNQETMELTVTMADHPDDRVADGSDGNNALALNSEEIVELGAYAVDIPLELRKKAKLPAKRGVLVTSVTRGSIAARAGLRAGDFILKFGFSAVPSVKALARMVARVKAGDPITLHVQRDGRLLWVALRKR